MRIIAISHLRMFWQKFPDAEQALKSWVDEVRHATWNRPADIKDQYRNASFLKNRRVVFNIKGNDYRLVVAVHYDHGQMFVRFIGSHRQYDKIKVETI